MKMLRMKKLLNNIVILYSFFWMFLALFIIMIFEVNQKTFLWVSDGLHQHFTAFSLLCDYLGSFIKEHKNLPSFNYTVGQGSDVLTVVGSYDFTDPISIFSALLFPISRINRYYVMIFIKLYLAGMAFLYYCYSVKIKKRIVVLSGAIAYCISGINLFYLARHPNFTNWAYFFPLLLAGIEIYFRKKRNFPFIIFVFFNCITNFYTLFINTILIMIYVLVHTVVIIVYERTVKMCLFRCLRLAGCFCIGILLSMAVLLPTLYAFHINAKTLEPTGYTLSLLHYDLNYYRNLPYTLFTPFSTAGHNTIFGFNAVAILSLILLFSTPKKYIPLKVLILISICMLCLPFAGLFMNGFRYATNRHVYALSFYVAFALVVLFDTITNMSQRNKTVVLLSILAYMLICVLSIIRLFISKSNIGIIASVFYSIVFITMVFTIIIHCHFKHMNRLVFVLVYLSAFLQIYITFSPSARNYSDIYLSKKRLNSVLSQSSQIVKDISKDIKNDFYRVEMEEQGGNGNTRIGIKGTTFFWSSMIPRWVSDYYTNLGLPLGTNCSYYGIDGRTGLCELASVKYYTRPIKADGLVPYGYEEIKFDKKKYQVFENQYVLPIGYTYATITDRNKYDTLNCIKKEYTMLQSAVLEKSDYDDTGVLKKETLDDLSFQEIPYTIINQNNITYKKNSIKVSEKDGSLILNTFVPEDCEVYLYLKNIKLLGTSHIVRVTANCKSESFTVSKSSAISNRNNEWFAERDDVVYNLGYGHVGKNTIRLSFAQKSEFTFDAIKIVAVPMSYYRKYVSRLREHVLENVFMDNDIVTGTITVPDDRLLQFSIPYSKGWTAFIDGKKTELLRSNIMYMSVPVSIGKHTVVLKYTTPYLKQGIIISFVTLILCIVFAIAKKVYFKHKKQAELL